VQIARQSPPPIRYSLSLNNLRTLLAKKTVVKNAGNAEAEGLGPLIMFAPPDPERVVQTA
jgi:hypothetical protein